MKNIKKDEYKELRNELYNLRIEEKLYRRDPEKLNSIMEQISIVRDKLAKFYIEEEKGEKKK